MSSITFNDDLSLVSRYHLLHQRPESPLALEKVRFNVGGAGTITCGLKATRFIPVASFLLSAGGSMSSDLVQGKPAISIIESSMQQKGPHGPRLLLGPFRFANHDCKPNCQVWPHHEHSTLLAHIYLYTDHADTKHSCVHPLFHPTHLSRGFYHR